jgi:hypothetical protein
MNRLIPSIAFALAASALAAHAQETTVKSKTKSSGGDAQTVSYTGCVQTGTEDLSTGQSSSSTTYMLVPGETVQVQSHVGHKVEVTGTLIPGGDVKSETNTKVDRDDAKDTKTRTRTESKNSMPQFKVTSIKDLSESCN